MGDTFIRGAGLKLFDAEKWMDEGVGRLALDSTGA